MNLSNVKVIMLHGNGEGSGPENHWYPYVKNDLTQRGATVIAKKFPDLPIARMEKWIPFLEELGADENTILIGHSTGAVCSLRYAENHIILGSVLVGVNYTDLGYEDEKLSGYYDAPWMWEKIKVNQKFIIQFASTDDPFIPIKEPRFIAKNLSSDYHEFTDQKHFGHSEEFSKKEFPELLSALLTKLEKIN